MCLLYRRWAAPVSLEAEAFRGHRAVCLFCRGVVCAWRRDGVATLKPDTVWCMACLQRYTVADITAEDFARAQGDDAGTLK